LQSFAADLKRKNNANDIASLIAYDQYNADVIQKHVNADKFKEFTEKIAKNKAVKTDCFAWS
jgi:hypothetical protein